jgi:hypothetical protein
MDKKRKPPVVNGSESPIQVGCTTSIFKGPGFKKRFSKSPQRIYIQDTHFEWGIDGLSVKSMHQTAHVHTDQDDVALAADWQLDLNGGFPLLGGVTLRSDDGHTVNIFFWGGFEEILDQDANGQPIITIGIGNSKISSATLTTGGQEIDLKKPKGPIQIQWK